MARRTVDPAPAPHIEKPGPTDFTDPLLRVELKRAAVWIGMAVLVAGIIVLAQPLMLIIGGLVFAVMVDGGARLLGRVLPIRRGLRILLIILLAAAFLGWTGYVAGSALAAQFGTLRLVVTEQLDRLLAFATGLGLLPEGGNVSGLAAQAIGGIGKLTSAVGSAIGALTTALLIVVIGLFIAGEPHLYDRGVAWMLPTASRPRFYRLCSTVGATLRRLLAGRLVGMAFEGVFTWAMLALGGVPMAGLLGLITGLLAFLPNIGALVSGVLMVAVGFSAGNGEGLWAIFTYFFVQNVDGYLVVPYIARRRSSWARCSGSWACSWPTRSSPR